MKIHQSQTQETSHDLSVFIDKALDLEVLDSVDYLFCYDADRAPGDKTEFSMENCGGNDSSCADPINNASRWSHSLPMAAEYLVPIRRTNPYGVGAGLKNIGNTCYINAVLQCFTHTVPLLEGLRSSKHPMPCYRSHYEFCVLCTFRNHVQHSLTTNDDCITPANFFNNLNYFSSSFAKFEQEDAHEFLQCFLDRLESCFPDSETSLSSDVNLVKKVFGGRLMSKLKCCNCGYCSETPERLIDLSLGIEDVDSLTDALDSFTKAEKIEDSEPKFRCDNCKMEADMVKQIVVDEAPNVAMFHLKRFKADGLYVQKIDSHVKFPMELDLRSYTVDASDQNNVGLKYDLYGVVVHSGLSITYGHYISFIRSSENKWHRFNDSMVTEVTEEDVLSENAYILFYARSGTPWFSNFMDAKMLFVDPETRTKSPKSVLESMENACMVTSDTTASVSLEVAKCLDEVERIKIESCSVAPVGESDHPQEVEEVSRDEVFHPLTPPRPQIKDDFSFQSPGVTYQIPRDHLKSEERPSRKRVNRSADDSQKKEAARYLTKNVQSSRGSQLMQAIFGTQSDGAAARKKRKIGSPCKGPSPTDGRPSHASISHHPVATLMR